MVADCRGPLALCQSYRWPESCAGPCCYGVGTGSTASAYDVGLQWAEQFTRHTGGSNAAFFDGHVKWVRWNNIKNSLMYPTPADDIWGGAPGGGFE